MNPESGTTLIEISKVRVKSEEDSESSNSMRAVLTNDQLGRVGADCDGGGVVSGGGGAMD